MRKCTVKLKLYSANVCTSSRYEIYRQQKALLFGPFAGFSPKFLKTGSNLDLIGSVKPNNVLTMLAAGVKEMGLTKYLIQQVMLSHENVWKNYANSFRTLKVKIGIL